MSIPSRSAESSVRDSDFRPADRGDANRPCSRRFDQMKNPPCSKPRTFTIVRRRLMNTYQRPLAGFSPRWLETSAQRPSKLRRMSAGSVDSQMPPAGQPPNIRTAAPEAPRRRPATTPHPSPDPAATSTKLAGLTAGPAAAGLLDGAAAAGRRLLNQSIKVLGATPLASQKPICVPSQRSYSAISA